MELTVEEVKRAAKREDFRAGVQMRIVMPRLSVHVTRWVLAHTRLDPNDITIISLLVGLASVAAFASTSALVVAVGVLGYHLHVLLDYVDGEVARCRGITSVRGAYLDLITDRITFPLFIFCAGLGVFRVSHDPTHLVIAFIATFGLFLDKEVVDCWYRANTGAAEIEDRYVEAPERGTVRRWRSRAALLAVMVRGLTAFLTYIALATLLDAYLTFPIAAIGSYRALILWIFAPIMPLGALARFAYVYRRGAIPRRQQLL